MILFCDTSALLKLYVNEPDSGLVFDRLDSSEGVAVSRIAWAEAHSAFARRAREEPQDNAAIESAKEALRIDWPGYVVIEINQSLVELAGEYAEVFALRGYDSVQLACASQTAMLTQNPVCFASFDLRLNKAAKALGMTLL
jgi:uncharacterized protein